MTTMMRSAQTVLALLLSVQACQTPSSLPDGVVLRYGVHSHFSGSVSLTVGKDGMAEYDETGGPPGSDAHVRARVEAPELHLVAETLRQHDFCSLRSGRSRGVPDEAKPSIAVRLEGMDCSVTLWDNEFSDDPHAHACLAVVETLGRTLKSRSAASSNAESTEPHP